MFNYAAKFFNYVLIAVVGTLVAGLSDWHLTSDEIVNILILAGGAAAVYLKANTPEQPWAKMLVAVFVAGVTVLVSAWSDYHISGEELTAIILAVLGAIQVGAAANSSRTVAGVR
jgi:ABC-type Fe3+-siderophore transport system permease subunit